MSFEIFLLLLCIAGGLWFYFKVIRPEAKKEQKDRPETTQHPATPQTVKEAVKTKIEESEALAVEKTKQIKNQIKSDWDKVDTLDHKMDNIKRKFDTDKAKLKKSSKELKEDLKDQVLESGVCVKRGRYHHRAVLIRNFRLFTISKFSLKIREFDTEKIKDIAKGLDRKPRKILKDCLKTASVTVDAAFYDEVLKVMLTPQQRAKYFTTTEEVDQEAVKRILPELPYATRFLFWDMPKQYDSEGNPKVHLHPKTHNAKLPGCSECGAKFYEESTVCRECGIDASALPLTLLTPEVEA